MGLVTGIIPTLVVLMTGVNAIIRIVGQDKVERFAAKYGKYTLFRYTVLPIMSVFFLTNPMCYTFGRFVEEKYKPAYYDAAVSFVHPITGFFPHANSAEIFVYMGIAQGVESLGFPLGALALRYFAAGVLVILIRGIVTEKIYAVMCARRKATH